MNTETKPMQFKVTGEDGQLRDPTFEEMVLALEGTLAAGAYAYKGMRFYKLLAVVSFIGNLIQLGVSFL